MMDLLTKQGTSKLVEACTYPLTGLAWVSRVYADLAVFDVGPRGASVVELVEGYRLTNCRLTGVPLGNEVHRLIPVKVKAIIHDRFSSATPCARQLAAMAASANIRADDLGAVPMKALLARNPDLDPGSIEEVFMAAPISRARTIECRAHEPAPCRPAAHGTGGDAEPAVRLGSEAVGAARVRSVAVRWL
jgi:hypothetical protein